ncbi:D-glycero-beta-D-manno-heptose 1,7-bisphosphate 7-phosphatase [Halochromatium roseum]|uniref:D-glycero-beta-D-manno-heptose 1,7-bisphosphate 7-phosphatase n=1 Tax=Halochromatium roseum TaxID=391920 RepID=UPI00191303FF|nr:D-glycero-beta-D-manno-heptose 1,7-bisphosphate 7-phosphatase [Halochromatium roseum]MBK5937948.1 D-glycero-beta-D-manno-heptose-1,7-bisphosphate 7-phosphatase [Halochromatium roseum]
MKLVILDRDGVINYDSEDYIKSADEWYPIPGSLEAIARLNNAGISVAVATNQSAVARGLCDLDDINAIHQALRTRLSAVGGRVEVIAFCHHGPSNGCECRKPLPGLLREIRRRTGFPLSGTPMIGDSRRDLEAALGVGAQPILVRTGNGEKTEQLLPPALAEVPVFDDLAAAVDALLQRS